MIPPAFKEITQRLVYGWKKLASSANRQGLAGNSKFLGISCGLRRIELVGLEIGRIQQCAGT